MDASSLQQQQEIMASQSLDSMLICIKSENQSGQIQQQQQQQQQQQDQKKPKPADQQALKCPRCDSTNTKFCYYNNYSLTQPRYFCKSCRRYWTKGGTLRNVPVGGGCRKNRRSSSSSSSASSRSRVTVTPDPSSFSSPFEQHHQFARLQRSMGVGGRHEDHGSIPLLGNLNNPHFDLFGNNNLQHDLYYGFGGGSGNLGDVENGRGNIVNNHEDHLQQMGMQFENLYHNHNYNQTQEMISNPSSGSSTPTTTTTIKQEMLGENNRVLLGLPWQLTSGEGNYMNGGAESWSSGVLGSSWHGLLNSPLM